MHDVDPVALTIFLFFFLLVTVLGFLASRWRRVSDLDNLDEWGLGGRSFGTFVAWFLIGGDIYTAYTFIAVPATLYAGSVTGFFAVPYTIVLYPIIFMFLPRLWSVSHRRRYVTPADFVQGRFDSKGLSLAIAFTGILATLPYIALQLVGIQAVLDVIGLTSPPAEPHVLDTVHPGHHTIVRCRAPELLGQCADIRLRSDPSHQVGRLLVGISLHTRLV